MDTLVNDQLWNAIAPYLPEHPPAPTGGRPRVPDRLCLNGIVFVLREGIRWQSLPTALGWGSGSTCWRRFEEWPAAGDADRAGQPARRAGPAWPAVVAVGGPELRLPLPPGGAAGRSGLRLPLVDHAGSQLGDSLAAGRAWLAAWQRLGADALCRGANPQLVRPLPAPDRVLREQGYALPGVLPIGGLPDLCQTPARWSAGCRALATVRPGRIGFETASKRVEAHVQG